MYTDEVLRHWAASGHCVTLFASKHRRSASEETVGGVRIVRRGGVFGVYREARWFYETEGRGRYDLVVDQVNTRPFLCPAYVKDTRLVGFIHQVAMEVWDYELPRPLGFIGRHWLEPRWLKQYADTPVLTVSASSASSLVPYGLTAVTVVPEGLRLPRELPKSTKAPHPTLIFVGRMAANKRPDHALAAFRLARRHVPGLRLWMVGSGALLRNLSRRAPQGVTFFGRVDETTKFDLLSRAHVIVATSVREGWGLMISEAAAVGTPAIAYDVPGLSDSVAATGGTLVAPDPQSMAAKIVLHARNWGVTQSCPLPTGTEPWERVAELMLSHALDATGTARRSTPLRSVAQGEED